MRTRRLAPIVPDSAQLTRSYLETSPAVLAAKASVAASSASVRSSRTDYLPTISTSYGITNNIADTTFNVWQGRTLQNKSFGALDERPDLQRVGS